MGKGYSLPKSIMTNTDLHRLINSDEIQSVVRPMKTGTTQRKVRGKNPLRNAQLMDKLNPGSTHRKTLRKQALVKGSREFETIQRKKEKRVKASKAHRSAKREFYNQLKASYVVPKDAEEDAEDDEE